MKIMTVGEAQSIVAEIKDRLGNPVDEGIAEALTHFIRFARALGFETSQSCEGHIDWGLPFPWIEFEVSHGEIQIPPWWNLLRLRERMYAKKRESAGFQYEMQQLEWFCILMTRYVVRFEERYKSAIQVRLHIHRSSRLRFRLVPEHEWISQGHKTAADVATLNKLLESQRSAFILFATFCVEELAHEKNLIGAPEQGCPIYTGKG